MSNIEQKIETQKSNKWTTVNEILQNLQKEINCIEQTENFEQQINFVGEIRDQANTAMECMCEIAALRDLEGEKYE